MSLLNEIIKEFLIEDASINRVNDAIKKTYEVEINYHSKGEDIATGKRIIQPVAYGLTKAGNPVVRAFQPYGDTTTKIPSWKFFRIDRISSWKPFPNRIFNEPPAEFNAEGDFNPNGDKTMSVVYTVANFNNSIDYSSIDNSGPITKNKIEPEIYKTDTEKGIERLQQQLQNPKYFSDVNKKNGLEHLRNRLEDPNYISDIIKLKNFGDDNSMAVSGPVKKDDISTDATLDKNNNVKAYDMDSEENSEEENNLKNNI